MIVVGLGFRAQASAEALEEALLRATDGASPHALATSAAKATAPALAALAEKLGLPVLPIAPDALAAQTCLSASPQARARIGAGSLAEAAALAASQGYLLGPRVFSDDRSACAAAAETVSIPEDFA